MNPSTALPRNTIGAHIKPATCSRGHSYYIGPREDDKWSRGVEYTRRPSSSTKLFEKASCADEGFEARAYKEEPFLKPLIERLRKRYAEVDKIGSRDKIPDELRYWAFVEPVCAPITTEESQVWKLLPGEELPSMWTQQQHDLCALGLLESSRDGDLPVSTLSLDLSALSPRTQEAIRATGLLGDSAFLPLISICTTWDREVYHDTQYPVEELLADSLPSLRLLRTLQHRITPPSASHRPLAPVRTGTLLFTPSDATGFVHTIEPGNAKQPARTRIIFRHGISSDLFTARSAKWFRQALLDSLLAALEPGEAKDDCERLQNEADEWTMEVSSDGIRSEMGGRGDEDDGNSSYLSAKSSQGGSEVDGGLSDHGDRDVSFAVISTEGSDAQGTSHLTKADGVIHPIPVLPKSRHHSERLPSV
ncbi:hypothetical protein OC842_007820 [Tilletia horrida]|uniref:Uncharacterized protein n=1 Tax=Tilletia horrida TaxID=155126 RepID=A0AAN6JGI5_9BASI|nr:hypothetical protein OC842_007820 [Tilletia horrida]